MGLAKTGKFTLTIRLGESRSFPRNPLRNSGRPLERQQPVRRRLSGAVAAVLIVLLVMPGAVWGEDGDSGAQKEGADGAGETPAGELRDLGRQIREAMQAGGAYVGDKLTDLGETSGPWIEDRVLQARVKTAVLQELGWTSLGQVDVDVAGGRVTLSGELESWQQVAQVVRAAEQVDGVRRVTARLEVPDST